MPDQPHQPPLPDALRAPRPAPAAPKVDILNDVFNPIEPKPPPRPAALEPKEKPDEPASGLAEFDAPHAFASVLTSGFGRVIGVIAICMLAFGITEACHRVSLIFEGWRTGGFSGFFGAIFAVPGAILAAPGHWIASLGDGITEPLGAPYLMLFIGGVILAVRSEIHLLKMLLFYGLLSAIHAAAYLKMKNPLSLLLWLAFLAGLAWLYRSIWRQQFPIEESAAEEES